VLLGRSDMKVWARRNAAEHGLKTLFQTESKSRIVWLSS
jgi:hypothetical protein